MESQQPQEHPLFERVLNAEHRLVFGLLGERLGHSHSPAIHAVLGSTPYELVEVPRDRVAEFLAAHRFSGLNVTIPYKRTAAEACDELSPAAARLGNANTLVVRPDGTLYGDNTDYHGFTRQLASTGVSPAGKCCLVLGNGGAAATVRAVLEDAGAAEVLTATRRGGEGLLSLSELNPADAHGAAVCRRVSLIVNATPVGMYPHADDEPAVDLACFPQLACVCDLVYNPLSTRLIQQARELGVAAVGGLLMLVAQAKRSSDLFLNEARPDDVEDGVYAHMLGRLRSVSLIGMPGCGKTVTGRLLAKELGCEFVDVDKLVAERAGMPVHEIFATQGEEAFRVLESACTAEALSRPGRVVTTGGGVVTRPCNLAALRQNGPVVLLTRGLNASDGEELALSGRPVSQAKGIARLRDERAPLYHAWADIEVAPDPAGPLGTARAVAEALRGWAGR